MNDPLPELYDELRALAAAHLARERPGHTLQPTAIVHEAWLRLRDADPERFGDREPFLAIASRVIRRVLVDHARRRATAKRGEAPERVALDEGLETEEAGGLDLLLLDEALERLANREPRQARVVELRFFGGLDVRRTAEAIGVSPRTVDGDWAIARAWLLRELSAE